MTRVRDIGLVALFVVATSIWVGGPGRDRRDSTRDA